MARYYLLDTQAAVWLITGDSRLPQNIRENIEYRTKRYAISVITLMEIVQLMTNKKISTKPLNEIEEAFRDYDIDILGFLIEQLEELQRLPVLTINKKLHADPFDRLLISVCTKYRLTMVSADLKFPAYRKYGLTLIKI